MAWALGLVHDAGKAGCAWQDKLQAVAATGAKVNIDHETSGALALRQRALAAAMAVLGDHGGLGTAKALSVLKWDGELRSTWDRFLSEVPKRAVCWKANRCCPLRGWKRR